MDPDSEDAYFGLTESDNHQVSIIFLEPIKDASTLIPSSAETIEQQTVVHEIGWQVLEGGSPIPNTIMAPLLPVDPAYEKFDPAHIAEIRSQTSSPGI